MIRNTQQPPRADTQRDCCNSHHHQFASHRSVMLDSPREQTSFHSQLQLFRRTPRYQSYEVLCLRISISGNIFHAAETWELRISRALPRSWGEGLFWNHCKAVPVTQHYWRSTELCLRISKGAAASRPFQRSGLVRLTHAVVKRRC